MASSDYFTINNIIALILGIVGLIWLIRAISRNTKINNIATWPKVNATVLNAVIAPANGGTYINPKNMVVSAGDNSRYRPIVLYRYRVANKDYQSSSVIYSGDKTYDALGITVIMGQLYPGAVIPVYYNPKNFSESYIYNGTHNNSGIIWGIIFILIAIYLAFNQARRSKSASRFSLDLQSPNLTEIEKNIKHDISAINTSLNNNIDELRRTMMNKNMFY